MPAETPSINLLSDDDSSRSSIGKLVIWITSYGRYIMVTTELIVIIVFVSRFSLDRALTDINEEISQKQSVIQANRSLEENFRNTQASLLTIKSFIQSQVDVPSALETIHTILPSGVFLDSLSITNDKVSATVTAVSVESFSYFLSNLSTAQNLSAIEIGSVTKLPSQGIKFAVTATIVSKKPAS